MDVKIRTYLISNICRYYKGGSINPIARRDPSDPRALFWMLEWEFVNDYYDKEELRSEYTLDFILEFGVQDIPPYNSILLSLRAFLFARYYQTGGSAAGFTGFLDKYLQSVRKYN